MSTSVSMRPKRVSVYIEMDDGSSRTIDIVTGVLATLELQATITRDPVEKTTTVWREFEPASEATVSISVSGVLAPAGAS